MGAHLTEGGHDTVLVERDLARVELLNREGLRICSPDGAERLSRLRVLGSVQGMEPADLVVLTVKSYDTEKAVHAAMPVITGPTQVLTLQNGVGHPERIARLVSPERVLGGVTFHSIEHLGPNQLRFRKGERKTQLAPFTGKVTLAVRRICEVFNQVGLGAELCDDLQRIVWQKLTHNAAVNPVAALTGLTFEELLADEDLMMLSRALVQEVTAVMRAQGIPPEDTENPFRPVMQVMARLGENRPSMAQDLSRGIPTEIEAINGAVVRVAGRLGLAVPLNWTVVRLIRSRERRSAHA